MLHEPKSTPHSFISLSIVGWRSNALIIWTCFYFSFSSHGRSIPRIYLLMARSISGILAVALVILIISWLIFAIFLFTEAVSMSTSIILSRSVHSVWSNIASLLLSASILSLVLINFLNINSLVSLSLTEAMGEIGALTSFLDILANWPSCDGWIKNLRHLE